MTEVQFDDKMYVTLIDFMGGDLRAVQAARVSTKGTNDPEPGEGKGLVNFLMRERHEVPFEHSVFTFHVAAPIFVTRQILKHRITSISETSGRYRELEPIFYIPSKERPVVQIGKTGNYDFVDDPVASDLVDRVMREAADDAWTAYEGLINGGVSKEVARMVLPENIYSSLYITINARSLINFLGLRDEKHAQYEIQDAAKQVSQVFEEYMPWTYGAWQDRSYV